MPWLLKEEKLIHTKNGLMQTTVRTEILSPPQFQFQFIISHN